MRRGAKPSKAKVPKSRESETSRIRDLEARLADALKREAEALEQQTATSDILRVISSSPTDIQPVFNTIAERAVRLCDAAFGAVFLFNDGWIEIAALAGLRPDELDAARRYFPRQPSPGSTGISHVALTGEMVHIPDVKADAAWSAGHFSAVEGYRTCLIVPLNREGRCLGAINVWRREASPFSEQHIELLKTFADQAVIAIENVRLFTELERRNRDLTATSEILKVIASSPTDPQPVFDTIAASATRLCDGVYGMVFRFDGELITIAAQYGSSPERLAVIASAYPAAPGRQSVAAQAILERRVIALTDAQSGSEYPHFAERAQAIGYHSMVCVPMLRSDAAIGAITVVRVEARPFTDAQIELLKTFADQAVIAIETVRLFNELQTSNRHLTETLDKQTATSDILRAISRSQADVQPVFDEILSSALRLMGAYAGALTRIRGDHLHLAAFKGSDRSSESMLRAAFPRSLEIEGAHADAIRYRSPVNIAQAQSESGVLARSIARAAGYQSMAVVPMLHHETALGTIAVARHERGGFTEDEITLLQTFADQAVIAIENARLLSELQTRTDQLTRSVEELTALGDVSRAITSTLNLETVLETIVARAVQLSGADAGSIYEYDERAQELSRRAVHNMEAEILARPDPVLRKGEGALGQAVERRRPVQFADIGPPSSYESKVRDLLLRYGYRALLAVPLLREDLIIGALVVNRKAPGEFPPETVELLTTFATQSALAIQNARLFREIEEKSRQLEAASQHKSEFLANMSHELRTPLNAVIGFSEVLTERMFGELNEKQEEYLKDIHTSGQHLLSLINDILDLSKIEAGRMELEVSDFDLPMTIDNALMLVRERAARRSIALHTTVDERLGDVQGDERKIRQVLLNLLSNAIKFTPEGGRIEVGAKPVNGSIEVSVSDTGVGIAPEDQEAVFEEFKQVGTADKKVEGTGLGLALSRKFIELHGGKIWVKSQVGAGSTFTFTVPVRRGE